MVCLAKIFMVSLKILSFSSEFASLNFNNDLVLLGIKLYADYHFPLPVTWPRAKKIHRLFPIKIYRKCL